MSLASKTLRPLFDRVLIQRLLAPTKTSGGVILPDKKSQLNEGVVMEVGPGLRGKDGVLVPVPVKKGDKVLLPDYGGTAVKIGEQDLFLIRSEDILAIVEEKL